MSKMKRLAFLLPLLFYATISMVLFGNHIENGGIFNPGSDATACIWCLHWWPYAIAHGINPFISHYVWEPTGFNLMWSTSMPTLGLLFAPMTWLFSATTTFNVLTLAAPALAAYTTYLLLRYLACNHFASFIGGFLFGFSSYVTGQMLGHLSLDFVAIVPLFLLLSLKRINRQLDSPRFIVLMTGCAVLQFGISHEILATSALFGMLGYLTFYRSYRKTTDLHGFARDTCISGAVSLIALSPALYYMYLGASEVPAIIHPAQQFSADLLNFVIPTPVTRLGRTMFTEIASRYTASYSEQGAYLGLPLLALTALAARDFASRVWFFPLSICVACSVLLSLGPVLQINGHSTSIPLPWRAIDYVPVIRHALPMRLVLYTSLLVAILAGLWLSSGLRGFGSITSHCFLAAAAVVFVLPNPDWFVFKPSHTPGAFLPSTAGGLAGRDQRLIVLPFGYLGDSLLWQVDSKMGFKMLGGYVGFMPKYFYQFPAISYFNGDSLPATLEELANDVFALCVVNGVTGIMIAPGTEPMLAQRLKALSWEHRTDGETVLLRVPLQGSVQFSAVTGDYWPKSIGDYAWMGKRILVVTGSAPRTVIVTRKYVPEMVKGLEISTTVGDISTSYSLGRDDVRIVIPAATTVRIDALKTWSPATVLKNGDLRELSVAILVKEGK